MTIAPDARIQGQIAIITGANRVIGRQIAKDLAAAGARVAATARNPDTLSGRFIHALDDLDDLIRRTEEITADNLQTLALRSISEHY